MINKHTEMQMITACQTGDSCITNNISAFNQFAFTDRHAAKMGIYAHQPAAVINADKITVNADVIGKNNLLVTPEFGTRVRLRGMFIEAELEPTDPIDFNPCNGCDRPCHKACPRNAFRSGSFERPLCAKENDKREAAVEELDGSIMGIDEPSKVVKPCRVCELACPVAQ